MRAVLWRHQLGAGMSLLGLLLLARFVLQARDGQLGWVLGSIVACMALPGWWLALRRSRLLQTPPLCPLSAAAQGYVALTGRARALPGNVVVSPMTLLPCVWYRVRIRPAKRGDDADETVDYCSDASFLLEDDGAQCLIDPEGAEVLASRRDSRRRGDMIETHWTILDGDPLFAQGDLRLLEGDGMRTETDLTKEILADWKADREDLHQRFDLDRNGQLDMQEWALARNAAQREARNRREEALAMPELQTLSFPRDRRPYLVSTWPRHHLLAVARIWAGCAALAFVLAAGLIGWGLSRAH